MIDFGPHTVKALEVTANSREAQVLRACVAEIPDDVRDSATPDAAGAFLRRVLNEAGFGRARAVTALPRHLAVVKHFTLPPGDEAETDQMMQFRAEREVPFALDGARLAYTAQQGHEEAADGQQEMLLCAAREDAVKNELARFREAKIRVAACDLSSAALARALQAFCDDEPAALADVSAERLEVVIVSEHRLIYSRSVRLAVTAEPYTEAWKQSLAAELKRTLTAFAVRHGDARVKRLVLSGEAGRQSGIETQLAEELALPVERYRFPAQLKVAPDAGIEAEDEALFAISVGLYLPGTPRLDLLSPRRPRVRHSARRRAAVWVALAAAAVVVGVVATAEMALRRQEQRLVETRQELDKLAPALAEVERYRRRLRLVNAWREQRLRHLDALRSLSVLLPRDITLSSFSLDESNRLRLTGRAKSIASVADAVAKINGADGLQAVEYDYSREVSTKGGGVEFTLSPARSGLRRSAKRRAGVRR